ncbi:hypothetical protein Hanom_Chr08g00753821 [Helianthus anomalus]
MIKIFLDHLLTDYHTTKSTPAFVYQVPTIIHSIQELWDYKQICLRFIDHSNCSQSLVILVEFCTWLGAFRLPTPESNVSHFVIIETVDTPRLSNWFVPMVNFRPSRMSTKPCTRRTCAKTSHKLCSELTFNIRK